MRNLLFALLLLPLMASCVKDTAQVTLDSLLDEMISVEESARYPLVPYRCLQVSSYDRSSVSPDSPGWFANNDGYGIVCTDTVDGRVERVMFDEKGPGAITRIWITTVDKRGTWRFYFDGESTPGWIVPAYDLMRFGIPRLGRGLLQPHTSYTPDGKGGNTLSCPSLLPGVVKLHLKTNRALRLLPNTITSIIASIPKELLWKPSLRHP